METDVDYSDPQWMSKLNRAVMEGIPSAEALRESLGFGNGSHQAQAFNNAVKQFASEFAAENDTPSSTFSRWSEVPHKEALLDMADRFLEKHGCEFWDDDLYNQRYEYDQDHFHICVELGKLFLRETELARRKAPRESASVDPHESSTGEPRRDGLTKETAIDLDDYDAPSGYQYRCSSHNSPAVPPKSEPESSLSPSIHNVAQAPKTTPEQCSNEGANARHTQTEDAPMGDAYDGPQASASISNARGKRPASPQLKESDRGTKVPRRIEEGPNGAECYTSERFTPTVSDGTDMISPTSGRVRQQPHRQGYIMGDEWRQCLEPYADKPKAKRKRTREASSRTTRPLKAAPMAVMALGSVEGSHAGHIANDDPFGGPAEGSGSRVDDGNEKAVRKQSRSPTMGVLPNLGEGGLPEPDFQLENEPGFQPGPFFEQEQTPSRGEDENRAATEQRQSELSELESLVNGFRGHSETGSNVTRTDVFNIDYTVYNDQEEPVSGWTPPKHFFAVSFEELVTALPLNRPRGLRLCLEGAVKRKGFSRTACDQERFRLHQSRFAEMMKSWEDEVASKGGPKPSFEIIIEPLR